MVFEGSIPTCTCFHSENFCDLFLLLCCVCVCRCLGMVREERWGGRGEDAQSMKYDNNIELFVHIKLRIITNSKLMLPSGIVNPNITLLYLLGFRAYKSPTHFMWTTIRFTGKLSVDCHHKVLSRKTPLQQQFDGE